MFDFIPYKITDIHTGKGDRSHIIYAHVRDTHTDEICVSATLDYCANWIKDNIASKEKKG